MSRQLILPRAVFALAACLLFAPGAAAQGYPFSQRASVTQNVAFTEITVTYGRPVARGRELWGKLVPWDSVWHPGADSATVIRFSRDVTIEGRDLKAGEYSLWLIPRERGAWTLILSRAARVFHTPYPGAAHDALRFDVAPDSASHLESMSIYFPMVLRDEAEMRVQWGTRLVAVRLKAPYRPA